MLTTTTKINLGTLKFGVPHHFKYILKNEYNESITITKLLKGCNSCTDASLDKQILAAGEVVDLNVVFTPGSTGINNKNINIQYQVGYDKKESNLLVTFNASVE